jgi:putative flavoprotein involved in K+ transport
VEDGALGLAASAHAQLAEPLPGSAYDGDRPDGFMTMAEVIAFLERPARSPPPVQTDTTVTVAATRRRVLGRDRPGHVDGADRRRGDGRMQRRRRCRPSQRRPAGIDCGRRQYRNPTSSPTAACWSSGRPATGIQLADEIHRQDVRSQWTVGAHVRARARTGDATSSGGWTTPA